MNKPLDGIRVVECAMFHAGPGASAIMGDMGAEVIKIEAPGIGDPLRGLMRIGSIPFELPGGRNIFFEGSNRNKKSITVDLMTDKGQEIVQKLVMSADVFVTNMRRPAVKKMKISYNDFRKINPKLIYASVSAYGDKGPQRDQGGFDYQGQARSGLMYSMGEEGMPPIGCQFGLVDQATAFNASHQVLAALLARERFGGMGQEISVSILGSSMNMLYLNILIELVTGMEVPRHKRTIEYPMRNHYQCKDGRWLMMTLTPPERHWEPLCNALEHPELLDDQRFATDDKRRENAELLVSIFDKIFETRCRDEWLQVFSKYDLFCCAINRLRELKNDSQIIENNYIVDFEHPVLGKIKIPGYPAHFSECDIKTISAAPKLGEHTDEILSEICGYSDDEIKAMREEEVI